MPETSLIDKMMSDREGQRDMKEMIAQSDWIAYQSQFNELCGKMAKLAQINNDNGLSENEREEQRQASEDLHKLSIRMARISAEYGIPMDSKSDVEE